MPHPHRLHPASAFFLAAFLTNPFAHASATTSKGLTYAVAGDHKLRLDLYYPASPPPRAGYPLIISIHGGGWLIGNRNKDLVLRGLTRDGYAIASIDYRLSREAKYPAQIADTRHALQWLMKNATALHLDAKHIGATGASAGGHLALLLGLDPQTSPNPIKAICALYPPTDLISIVPPKNREERDNPVALLLGAPVSQRLALAKKGSPITYVTAHAPPVLLIHGDRDSLVPLDQSRVLNLALRHAGAKSSLMIFQGKGHAFGLDDSALRDVAGFFDRYLKN